MSNRVLWTESISELEKNEEKIIVEIGLVGIIRAY